MDNNYLKKLTIFILLYVIITIPLMIYGVSNSEDEVSDLKNSILFELTTISNHIKNYQSDIENMESKLIYLNSSLEKYTSNVKDIIEKLKDNNTDLLQKNKELNMKLEDIRLENEKLKEQVAQRSFF